MHAANIRARLLYSARKTYNILAYVFRAGKDAF